MDLKQILIILLSIFVIFGILSRNISVYLFIFGFVCYIALLIIVPTDAKSRGKSAPLWAFLTFIGGPVVGIVYAILANKKINA